MTYVNESVFYGTEDSTHICMARIKGYGGVLVTQAAVSSIACKVFDLSGATPDTAILEPVVTVGTSIYDALQTDDQWSEDDTGYNFAFTVPRTGFPTGDHTYLVEFIVTPIAGDSFPLRPYRIYAAPIRSS
jgi:hypothetical protein